MHNQQCRKLQERLQIYKQAAIEWDRKAPERRSSSCLKIGTLFGLCFGNSGHHLDDQFAVWSHKIGAIISNWNWNYGRSLLGWALPKDFASPQWIYIKLTTPSQKRTNFTITILYYGHQVSWKLTKKLRPQRDTYKLSYKKSRVLRGLHLLTPLSGASPLDPTKSSAPDFCIGLRPRDRHGRQGSGSFSFGARTL